MLRKVYIENYRGFEDVRFSDLRRVNIFMGLPSSGKTTALESIMNCGDAQGEG